MHYYKLNERGQVSTRGRTYSHVQRRRVLQDNRQGRQGNVRYGLQGSGAQRQPLLCD